MKDTTLKPEDALKALNFYKDGRYKKVHSFSSAGPILMGCAVTVTWVREKFKKAKGRPNWIQISGRNMAGAGHAVAIFVQGEGWVFLETQEWFNKTAVALNRAPRRKPPVY